MQRPRGRWRHSRYEGMQRLGWQEHRLWEWPWRSQQGPHEAGPCSHAEAVAKVGFHHSEKPLNDFKHADEEGG